MKQATQKKIIIGWFLFLSLVCFAWSAHGNDIISIGTLNVRDWITGLRPQFYLLPIRLALIFLVVGILCVGGFVQTRPEHLGQPFIRYQQVTLAVLGILLGSAISLNRLLEFSNNSRAWIFAISVILVVVLPRFVPFFVITQAGIQDRMTKGCYCFVALALALTFFL